MRRFLLPALAIVLFASMARAVDFGWQPNSDGGIEYLVQIEPELIDSFRREGFTSEVPPGLRDIRRIRIEVGNGKLPNQGDVTGPKITHAAPPVSQPTAADQIVLPAPPETYSHDEPQPIPAQPNSTAENSTAPASPPNDTTASSAAGASPVLDSSSPVPPLPFFQSGPAKSISSNSANAAKADQIAGEKDTAASTIPVSGRTETPTRWNSPGKPGLKPNEGPPIASADGDTSSGVAVHAGMPAAPNSGNEVNSATSRSPIVAAGKPWTALLLALFGLFASLGANVYLVWIHQAVRTKYQALAAQMRGGTAAV
jgi:hypothetical protein